MRKTIDLTRIDGCYSKELRKNCPTIKKLLANRNVSVRQMQIAVHTIVAQATINASAKQRFVSKLFECETKEEIDKLCSEAVIHGMYYRPKRTVRIV